MSDERAGGESDISIDSLLTRVRQIENIRKSQTVLRGACLAIVAGLFGFMGVTVYGSYKSLDSSKYAANLGKELQNEFRPDLERLASEGQHRLLPQLKEHLEKSVKERLPRLQARYETLARTKFDEIEKRFDRSALVYLREFEAALRKEMPEEDMRLIFYKIKQTEDALLEQLGKDAHQQMGTLQPKVQRLQELLRKLAESPELNAASFEDAKELFVEATIDLLKYEVLPAKGAQQ